MYMVEENKQNLKIRFRFAGGEEFEAEGSAEFIEEQRQQFLALIGKKASSIPANKPIKRTTYPLTSPQATQSETLTTPQEPFATELALPRPAYSQEPLIATSPRIPAVLADKPHNTARAWEILLKEEGDLVILRKKMRLSPQEAALLLVAGARALLQKPQFSALLLAQAMRKSGFGEGRLDRILAGEMKNGYLISSGSKRSRSYQATNEGFARAFVLAERLAGERA